MARNSEKAMTALARWVKWKKEEEHPKAHRPRNLQDCRDVRKAIRFRNEIMRDCSKLITQIQNPGLGEFKIRDLNDEINNMLRLKGNWEVRIKELGGPDFLKTAPKWFDREGREVPGMRGYKYFGAAKDLPGVREIIEKPVFQPTKKTRADLMKNVDADYYGYMDEEDGVLLPLEQEEEERARARAIDEWRAIKEAGVAGAEDEPDIYRVERATESDEEDEKTGAVKRPKTSEMNSFGEPQFIAHVPVPSQSEVEEALVRRKKMELLEKYASDSLIQQSQEARTLLGFQPSTDSPMT